MKRMIALVLSLVMALSLCAPAWGADTVDVSTQEALVAAVAKGGDITLKAGTYALPVITEKCTITCEAGVVFEGHTNLDIAGSKIIGASFTHTGDITIEGMINGIFVDCSFSGARALRWCYAGETVEFVNCVFDGTVYGVHFDGGANDAYFKDCTFRGFNAFAGELTKLTMEGCIFESDGGNAYNGANLWGNTEMTNCTFIFDGTAPNEWVDMRGDNTTGTFINCVVTDGTTTTPFAEVVGNYGTGNSIAINPVKDANGKYTGGMFNTDPTAYVAEGYKVVTNGDGTYSVVAKYVAEVGGTKYETLQAAVDVGGTVELLGDVTLDEQIEITKDVTLVSDDAVTVNTAAIAEAFKVTAGTLTVGEKVTLSGSNSIIEIYGGGCVIDGATVTTSSSANCAIGVDVAGAILTVKSGTVSSTGDHGSAIGMVDGTVNIQGGTIFVTSNSDRATVFNHGGTVNVTGGTIKNEGSGEALLASSAYGGTAVVNVSGGYVDNVSVHETNGGTVSVSGGYFNEDPSAYCAEGLTGVASDKAGYLYMVGEKKAAAAEVDVAAPVVSADKVDTTNTTVNNVVNTIGTNGVEIDDAALTAAAVGAANENKVTPTVQQAEALNDLPSVSGATVSDVTIVVQTYFDVEIEEVKVDGTAATSITVDITPMQQTVATTGNIIESNADIKVGENAVKVGDPAPVKITEPVQIKLQLPTSFAENTKVYITHEASVGTVIYEATVAADHTITFTTTHGFSPFTISVSDPGVKASIGTDNYADLQSAINYAGKDATIVVKASGESAVVKSETSFTVTTESGVTAPTISAGAGYKMVKEDVAGGVKYTFTKVTGGYYPYYPSTPDKLVESAKTADPVGLYFGVTALATLGSALLLKKKED